MAKVKMKTRKAAKKRFKITGTGKVVHKGGNARHILTKKTSKRKRQIRGTTVTHKADARRVRAMLNS